MNSEIFEMYRRPQALTLPELVSLGMFITSEPRIGGKRPGGPSELEIGYLERGSVEWWDGKDLEEAEPESVLIDPPGDWQGGMDAIIHPCKRYWLRVEFPHDRALPGLSYEVTQSMKRSFESFERRFFPGSPDLRDLFSRLLDSQRHSALYAEEFSRALFHQILVTVLRNYDTIARREISPQVAAAREMIEQNFRNKIRVEDVARKSGYSLGYFHQVFLQETGLTPQQFQSRLRIVAAKKALVHTSQSITDIALDLGYSSSQYFSTSFRRLVGLTPASYRKMRAGHGPSA